MCRQKRPNPPTGKNNGQKHRCTGRGTGGFGRAAAQDQRGERTVTIARGRGEARLSKGGADQAPGGGREEATREDCAGSPNRGGFEAKREKKEREEGSEMNWGKREEGPGNGSAHFPVRAWGVG